MGNKVEKKDATKHKYCTGKLPFENLIKKLDSY